MTEQHFELPFVHRSVNKWSRQHWAKSYKEKRRFEAMTRAVLIAQGAQMMPGKVEIEIILVFPVKRKRDRDNYACKFLLDAMKGLVIEDDSTDIVVSQSTEFRVNPDMLRTIIVVRSVDERTA